MMTAQPIADQALRRDLRRSEGDAGLIVRRWNHEKPFPNLSTAIKNALFQYRQARFTLGRMLPTRKAPDLLLGTWALLSQLGRVPRRLVWDNEPGIGGGKATEPVAVFAGTLATKVVLLPP
ncbi:MAG TPA: hypothetical protein VK054_06665, partial [Beutenbergiaceae bacterium]|nr:hypothetical protein [Beutenbergiaceae bacterium]